MTPEIAVQKQQLVSKPFPPNGLALLRNTIAKDHTEDEIKLFLAYCSAKGLDPFTREVYSVKRQGKQTFQTGIDGLRSLAEETGEYDGSEIYWCGEDGAWKDVWMSDKPPYAAKVVISRLGRTKPFTAIAKWAEYKPEEDWMWRKMPSNQLAKCAEALALRKAFPRKLGGLYANEEMAQADKGALRYTAPEAPAMPKPIETEEVVDTATGEITEPVYKPLQEPLPLPKALSEKQQKYLFGLGKKKGWQEEDVKAWTTKKYQKPNPLFLTNAELNDVLATLNLLPDVATQ